MKKVLVFLIDGFEEIEALTTIDILRRGNIDVTSISLENKIYVTGGHNICVKADLLFDDLDYKDYDAIVIPGGTVRITKNKQIKEVAQYFDQKRKIIAAICVAPILLGELTILRNKKAICYPSFQNKLDCGKLEVEKDVVVDGNIITAKGPASTLLFALTILGKLENAETKMKVAKEILLI